MCTPHPSLHVDMRHPVSKLMARPSLLLCNTQRIPMQRHSISCARPQNCSLHLMDDMVTTRSAHPKPGQRRRVQPNRRKICGPRESRVSAPGRRRHMPTAAWSLFRTPGLSISNLSIDLTVVDAHARKPCDKLSKAAASRESVVRTRESCRG